MDVSFTVNLPPEVEERLRADDPGLSAAGGVALVAISGCHWQSSASVFLRRSRSTGRGPVWARPGVGSLFSRRSWGAARCPWGAARCRISFLRGSGPAR
jgi:hypothetical protein